MLHNSRVDMYMLHIHIQDYVCRMSMRSCVMLIYNVTYISCNVLCVAMCSLPIIIYHVTNYCVDFYNIHTYIYTVICVVCRYVHYSRSYSVLLIFWTLHTNMYCYLCCKYICSDVSRVFIITYYACRYDYVMYSYIMLYISLVDVCMRIIHI